MNSIKSEPEMISRRKMIVIGSYHFTTILNQTNDNPQNSMDNTAKRYTLNVWNDMREI